MTIVAGRDCVRGVDVSRWQGGIRYEAFNLDFAYIKATGGDGGLYTDPQFVANSRWPTPWGPYHFASSGAIDATREADFFCDVILRSAWAALPADRKLPPVLDWEPTRTVYNSAAWVLTFLRRVEARTGVRPVIYTGAYVSLDRTSALLDYDLWLAAYLAAPIRCAPWGDDWSLWQYSSTGRVDGIFGNVDMNVATREWFDRVLARGSVSASIPLPAAPAAQPQETDDMAPPLYRFTDGTEFVLVASDDEFATEGFGWHVFEGPDQVRRAVAAGVVRESGIVQLQVEGSAVSDAIFESYPILNTSMRRPAAS